MNQILNLHQLCIVKIHASLERQKQYAATRREHCIITASMFQHQTPVQIGYLICIYVKNNKTKIQKNPEKSKKYTLKMYIFL